MQVLLQHVAHTRSGDKGNTSNIVVVAYHAALYPELKRQLTAERFKAFHSGTVKGRVDRYEIDHLGMLNFVAHDALGGGVSRNLGLDNYGKSIASRILEFELELPSELQHYLRGWS